MPRKFVSEKTLELNIAAEILTYLRGLPGCRDAFWIGLTQMQEDRLGLDEVLANAPSDQHLALRFKALNPTVADSAPFRFKVVVSQCKSLLRLCRPTGPRK